MENLSDIYQRYESTETTELIERVERIGERRKLDDASREMLVECLTVLSGRRADEGKFTEALKCLEAAASFNENPEFDDLISGEKRRLMKTRDAGHVARQTAPEQKSVTVPEELLLFFEDLKGRLLDNRQQLFEQTEDLLQEELNDGGFVGGGYDKRSSAFNLCYISREKRVTWRFTVDEKQILALAGGRQTELDVEETRTDVEAAS